MESQKKSRRGDSTIQDRFSSLLRLIWSLSNYFTSMVVLAAVSVMSIPVLVSIAGVERWAAVAIGQSVGAVAAMAVAFGWPVVGPSRVATADDSAAFLEIYTSLRVRLLVAPPVVALGSVAVTISSPRNDADALLGFAGAACIGLTSSWYYIGKRRPLSVLLFDTAPRATGIAFGLVLAVIFNNIAIALIMQLLGVILAGAIPAYIAFKHVRCSDKTALIGIGGVMRRQLRPAFIGLTTVVFAALPVVLAGLARSSQLPQYAVADRIYRQIGVALTPLANFLQGAIPNPNANVRKRRVLLTAVGCLLAASVIVLVSLLGGAWIFRQLGVTVSDSVAILVGILVSLTLAQYCLQLAVLPALSDTFSAWPIMGSSALALIAFPFALKAGGAEGGLLAVSAGLALSVLLLAVQAGSRLRHGKSARKLAISLTS